MPYYALLVSALLWLHLLAATAWVGGMAAMHFAVRPAAQQLLDAPAQRLAFMAGALRRFFVLVTVAIVVLLASGLALIALQGSRHLHWSVTAMTAVGTVMILVFAHIRRVPFVRLAAAVERAQWPAAAAALSTVRRLVAFNLTLGVIVYGIALIGRVL